MNLTISDGMRSGLGIGGDESVALLVFESQTEQAFRLYLPEIAGRYNRVFVCAASPNDQRLLRIIYNGEFENVSIVDTLDIFPACNELLLLRMQEELVRRIGIQARIIDPNNRWLSRELSR